MIDSPQFDPTQIDLTTQDQRCGLSGFARAKHENERRTQVEFNGLPPDQCGDAPAAKTRLGLGLRAYL
jgi:hypothetical protein